MNDAMMQNRPSKDILLVCATALEMRAAVSLLPGGSACDLSVWDQGAVLAPRLVLPRLCLPGIGLRLLVCGVGPVSSALSLALALSGREAESFGGVLNMGIAGSYDLPAAPVGEALLAEWECLPEYGVWPEADEVVEEARASSVETGMPLALSFAQGSLPSGPVFSRLPLDGQNGLGNLGLNCHTDLRTGGGATVAGVSGTRRRASRIARLTGALMESMEGFSLALGAAAAYLPFAEVRSLSNEAGCRPPHTWNMDKAARSLARTARALFAPFL